MDRSGAEWKDHWAFSLPEAKDNDRKTSNNRVNPIDFYIEEKLSEKGLQNHLQLKRKLIRRLYFDLTGFLHQ